MCWRTPRSAIYEALLKQLVRSIFTSKRTSTIKRARIIEKKGKLNENEVVLKFIQCTRQRPAVCRRIQKCESPTATNLRAEVRIRPLPFFSVKHHLRHATMRHLNDYLLFSGLSADSSNSFITALSLAVAIGAL